MHSQLLIFSDFHEASPGATTTIFPSSQTQALYDTINNLKIALEKILAITPGDPNLIAAIAALDQALTFMSIAFQD